ncbi:hypothetical protein [Ligilactobacillus sp. Marseille-Q7487]|uniref:hypothetical protein n=1 Tax=Ligilactobacillus sp. Marseille-Q7487 TaxID=3022128 RepID=UPI0024A7BC92|nr:hypothetical protein [Ligilactobacillus sp. Marseille-Q7487]
MFEMVWHFSATGQRANVARFLDDMQYSEAWSRLTIRCEFDDFIAINEVVVVNSDNEQEITGVVAEPFEFKSFELEELFEYLVNEYQLDFSLKVDFFNC